MFRWEKKELSTTLTRDGVLDLLMSMNNLICELNW